MDDFLKHKKNFAISVLVLLLIRNQYATEENVRFGKWRTVDLIARHFDEDDIAVSFGIEVSWLPDGAAIPAVDEGKRIRLARRYAMPMYFAFVVGTGDAVYVDEELKIKLLYAPDRLKVTSLQPAARFQTA